MWSSYRRSGQSGKTILITARQFVAVDTTWAIGAAIEAFFAGYPDECSLNLGQQADTVLERRQTFAPPQRVVNLMEALRRSVAEGSEQAALRKGAPATPADRAPASSGSQPLTQSGRRAIRCAVMHNLDLVECCFELGEVHQERQGARPRYLSLGAPPAWTAIELRFESSFVCSQALIFLRVAFSISAIRAEIRVPAIDRFAPQTSPR